MNYNKPTNLTIYETNQYDIFKILRHNRDLTKCKKLEKMIKKNNYLPYIPIIVSADFEVIDGQHRLEVAKKNNLPIYYIMNQSARPGDISDINQSTNNWKLTDHAKRYSILGENEYQENYTTLREMIDKFPFTISVLLNYFSKLDDRDRYKNGRLEFKYTRKDMFEFLTKATEILTKYKQYNPKRCTNVHLCSACLSLVMHPRYDHYFFMSQIDTYAQFLAEAGAQNSIEGARKVLLDEIYFKGKGKKKTFEFRYSTG